MKKGGCEAALLILQHYSSDDQQAIAQASSGTAIRALLVSLSFTAKCAGVGLVPERIALAAGPWP
jgi:hypothetical protein